MLLRMMMTTNSKNTADMAQRPTDKRTCLFVCLFLRWNLTRMVNNGLLLWIGWLLGYYFAWWWRRLGDMIRQPWLPERRGGSDIVTQYSARSAVCLSAHRPVYMYASRIFLSNWIVQQIWAYCSVVKL